MLGGSRRDEKATTRNRILVARPKNQPRVRAHDAPLQSRQRPAERQHRGFVWGPGQLLGFEGRVDEDGDGDCGVNAWIGTKMMT